MHRSEMKAFVRALCRLVGRLGDLGGGHRLNGIIKR